MKKVTLSVLMLFMGVVATITVMGLVAKEQPSTGQSDKQPTGTSGGEQSSGVLPPQEVAKHDSASDCYLIVNKKVYDVTSFINQHPGGRRSITSRCGQESTKIFAAIHSNFAWNLLNNYYIGDLGSATAASQQASQVNAADTLNQLEQAVKQAYPGAEVIKVSPKRDFYVAKLIYKGKLYEVHVDKSGKVLSKEVENDEVDWNLWDTDKDDE